MSPLWAALWWGQSQRALLRWHAASFTTMVPCGLCLSMWCDLCAHEWTWGLRTAGLRATTTCSSSCWWTTVTPVVWHYQWLVLPLHGLVDQGDARACMGRKGGGREVPGTLTGTWLHLVFKQQVIAERTCPCGELCDLPRSGCCASPFISSNLLHHRVLCTACRGPGCPN